MAETVPIWKIPETVNSGNVPIWTYNFDETNFPKIGPKKSQKNLRKMSINISLHKSARAWVKRRGCKICTYRLKHAKQTANNTNSHHCMHDCDRSSCVQLHGHALVMIWSRAMASWFSYKFRFGNMQYRRSLNCWQSITLFHSLLTCSFHRLRCCFTDCTRTVSQCYSLFHRVSFHRVACCFVEFVSQSLTTMPWILAFCDF